MQRFDISANTRARQRQQAFAGAMFAMSGVIATFFLASAAWKVLAGAADGYQEFLLVGSAAWLVSSAIAC